MDAITIIDDHGPDLRLTCRGEIDLTTAPQLERSVLAALGDGHERVVLDASQVTFLDSSGLRALMVIFTRCDELGSALQLHASEPVKLVFDALGVPLPGAEPAASAVRRPA
jgi:anti-sigma B factor antagonist